MLLEGWKLNLNDLGGFFLVKIHLSSLDIRFAKLFKSKSRIKLDNLFLEPKFRVLLEHSKVSAGIIIIITIITIIIKSTWSRNSRWQLARDIQTLPVRLKCTRVIKWEPEVKTHTTSSVAWVNKGRIPQWSRTSLGSKTVLRNRQPLYKNEL